MWLARPTGACYQPCHNGTTLGRRPHPTPLGQVVVAFWYVLRSNYGLSEAQHSAPLQEISFFAARKYVPHQMLSVLSDNVRLIRCSLTNLIRSGLRLTAPISNGIPNLYPSPSSRHRDRLRPLDDMNTHMECSLLRPQIFHVHQSARFLVHRPASRRGDTSPPLGCYAAVDELQAP